MDSEGQKREWRAEITLNIAQDWMICGARRNFRKLENLRVDLIAARNDDCVDDEVDKF